MALRLPRWAHRLYAFLFGYFWLPCPLCGRYFGGHEMVEVMWSGAQQICVCGRHQEDA